MTKSDQIGFVGGMEIPVIERFEAGFVAGVERSILLLKLMYNIQVHLTKRNLVKHKQTACILLV